MRGRRVNDHRGLREVGVRRHMGPKADIRGSWCGFGNWLPTIDSADGVPRMSWVWQTETTPVVHRRLGRPCRAADV